MKSTIKVSDFLNEGNRLLGLPTLSQDFKCGICSMIEHFLMANDVYAGFQYLTWGNGGCDAWIKDGQPSNNTPYLGNEYDRYYYHRCRGGHTMTTEIKYSVPEKTPEEINHG